MVPAPSTPPRPSRPLRIAVLVLAVVAGALLALGVWALVGLRASLPALDGELPVPGLDQPVVVERDALGVPRLIGATRLDLARALGFVHAQDRFFQMDLMRRQAAGELSELIGAATIGWDSEVRVHRLRATARRVVAAASHEERAVILAYADGVNAGLQALSRPPFEYLLLRAAPEPWLPEDTALVLESMFIELHDEHGSGESARGLVHELLPPAIADLLDARGTGWDAPIAGQAFPTPPLPGPEVLDLRRQPSHAATHPDDTEPRPASGSNNWAVAGSRTAHGGALVACDMHLGLAVPGVWYRAALEWGDETVRHRLVGVTLPGAPVMVAGSTGQIAWGFTNSYGDWSDLVVLEPAGEDSYRTPSGPARFESHRETISVRGEQDRVIELRSTIWGPVIDRDHRGRERALRWTAHDPDAVNFGLLGLERARDLDEALRQAHRAGIPPQNLVLADASGRIAWTIIGRIPRRFGHDGRLPTSWADGTRGWDGWLSDREVPAIVDPPEGLLWTANARVVGGDELERLGDGGYDLGARAGQIRDDLRALEGASERDMLAIQLDDRALFLARWRELLLATLDAQAIEALPARAELRRLVEAWGGRAAVGSAGYRIVRAFRLEIHERALAPLLAPLRAADVGFRARELTQVEGLVWRLVAEQPEHLLDGSYGSWRELLLASVDSVARELGQPLASRTWGERNTAAIRNRLSPAVPLLSRWLDAPREPLPGDSHMPRVQAPAFGASERMVVSPGREEQGVMHIPGGQGGHPLSPFYLAGHDAWARGEGLPLLPGHAVHRLALTPGR